MLTGFPSARAEDRTSSDQGLTGYSVVAEFPHDPDAFTQGLAFGRRGFYEGTGLNGESSLRKVRLATGEILMRRDLRDRFFGEGVTVLDGRIYQITWRNGVAFVYNRKTFERLKRFTYEGEGWGLTDDDGVLVMSDGTNVIRFRDPGTFEVMRSITVTDAGQPVNNLNELEWVNGEIFANVWQTDRVVFIDPETGDVTGSVDLSELAAKERAEGAVDVTNGIAFKPSEDRLFVTGKYWAHIYEIDLI